MKTIRKINVKELQGVELQRPEMKFLVGGCGSNESDPEIPWYSWSCYCLYPNLPGPVSNSHWIACGTGNDVIAMAMIKCANWYGFYHCDRIIN